MYAPVDRTLGAFIFGASRPGRFSVRHTMAVAKTPFRAANQAATGRAHRSLSKCRSGSGGEEMDSGRPRRSDTVPPSLGGTINKSAARALGIGLIALLSSTVAHADDWWKPAPTNRIALHWVQITLDGGKAHPTVLVGKLGKSMSVASRGEGRDIALEATVTRVEGDVLQLAGIIRENGKQVAAPVIRMHAGTSGAIRHGEMIDGQFHGASFDIVLAVAN